MLQLEQIENPAFDIDALLESDSHGQSNMKINRAFMARCLDEDACYRRNEEWPLHNLDVVRAVNTLYCSPNTTRFAFNNTNLCAPAVFYKFVLEKKSTITELLSLLAGKGYSHVNTIMGFFDGHMVLAGGAVTDMCSTNFRKPGEIPKDCDFFIWGMSVTDAEERVQKVIKWWLHDGGSTESCRDAYRNRYVTTLTDQHGDNIINYQIIHRVYRNKSSIIGGFDLSPAMALYDGTDILFTPLSLLSFAFGFFFVDVSRRSKTFDKRIAKYVKKGFRAVLNCATEEVIREYLEKTAGIVPGYVNVFVRIGEFLKLGINVDRMTVQTAQETLTLEQQEDYDNGQMNTIRDIQILNMQYLALGRFQDLYWSCKPNGGVELIFYNRILTNIKSYIRREFSFRLKTKAVLGMWFGHDQVVWIDSKTQQKAIDMFVDDKSGDLIRRICSNYELAKKAFKLEWYGMGQNPSRQRFTSSFHFEDETISWYNPLFMKPLTIGLNYEVYKTFWLGHHRKDCIISTLPKDIFKMILNCLRFVIAVESSQVTRMLDIAPKNKPVGVNLQLPVVKDVIN
jgi:hypothetical protein